MATILEHARHDIRRDPIQTIQISMSARRKSRFYRKDKISCRMRTMFDVTRKHHATGANLIPRSLNLRLRHIDHIEYIVSEQASK